jgi:hypothetical protein
MDYNDCEVDEILEFKKMIIEVINEIKEDTINI